MDKQNISRDEIAEAMKNEFGFNRKQCLDIVNDIIDISNDLYTCKLAYCIRNHKTGNPYSFKSPSSNAFSETDWHKLDLNVPIKINNSTNNKIIIGVWIYIGLKSFTDDNSGISLYNAVNEWITDRTAAEEIYGPISEWDTQYITNMQELFRDYDDGPDDINSWNISNVTNMHAMFSGNSKFNSELYNWDVSKVTDMEEMFYNAKSFDKYIRGWNVSSN